MKKTLRDEIAIEAMKLEISHFHKTAEIRWTDTKTTFYEIAAQRAYLFADAMIKARVRR